MAARPRGDGWINFKRARRDRETRQFSASAPLRMNRLQKRRWVLRREQNPNDVRHNITTMRLRVKNKKQREGSSRADMSPNKEDIPHVECKPTGVLDLFDLSDGTMGQAVSLLQVTRRGRAPVPNVLIGAKLHPQTEQDHPIGRMAKRARVSVAAVGGGFRDGDGGDDGGDGVGAAADDADDVANKREQSPHDEVPVRSETARNT